MNTWLPTLRARFQQLNNDLHIKLGQRDTLRLKLQECQARVIGIEQESERLTKASLFLQTLSDIARQQIIDKISAIVTDALQKIKDPNLEFKMILSTERNQMDVQFVVKDKTTEQEYDILNSCGGSIADIVTFPLKVSLLLKWNPQLSRLLILDEHFKFVSVQDREALGEFVKQVAEKLNLQVILVTHSPELTAKGHKVFEVTRKDGVSHVEERPS